MQEADFPCWLSPKDKAIAKALILKGFWYCGKAENFYCSEYGLTHCHGWSISTDYGELMIDAVRDGALFVCDLGDDANFESEVLRTKLAIRKAVEEWGEPIGIQLRLPL